MLIRIEQANGGKDRYGILSPRLLQILRNDWRLARPGRWLFPGQDPAEPVRIATLQEACRRKRLVGGTECRLYPTDHWHSVWYV
jgi:integrase/recombinase XerD